MSGNKDLLTVAEYADFKGITKQAVYKQLNNQLKQFVKEVDGQKYIDKAALSDEELNLFNSGLTIDEQQVKQQFANFEQLFNNSIQPLLAQQLEEKEQTIKNLFAQLAEKDKQIEALQNSLNQSQMLQAADKQLMLESQKKRKGLLKLFARKETEQ